MGNLFIYLLFISYFPLLFSFAQSPPNIIFFLTDDQDLLLGSEEAIPHVMELIAGQGKTFNNSFVTTPICCPSRSAMLTGRYIHNPYSPVTNNSINGNCSSPDWWKTGGQQNVGVYLQKLGYKTFYAGKLLNM